MYELIKQYEPIVGTEVIDELIAMAKILKGIKVLHINSTKCGGGVAEILNTMILLMSDLGVEAHWSIIAGSPDFFDCTKLFHNALQGKKDVIVKPSLLQVYEEVNLNNSEMLRSQIDDADIVFIHDPQPAALINWFPSRKNKWIWRCHIDLSNPHRLLWKYLRKSVLQYDASVFSLADFVQPLPNPMHLIPPSIDPLTDKNKSISPEEITLIYNRFQIDPSRPYILQVSRFDYFKDPLGVIKAYQMAKKFKKGLQLVLAGGSAPDDPEGDIVLNEVKKASDGDPDIHVLFLSPDSHLTINALQRGAAIVIQKSLKEGFGLTVTEALWKNKPVIGGNCGGIRLQVLNYRTGFLVNTPEGAAERIRYLLQNEEKIQEFGASGHQLVKEKFLITRHLLDYFALMISLLHTPQNGRITIS